MHFRFTLLFCALRCSGWIHSADQPEIQEVVYIPTPEPIMAQFAVYWSRPPMNTCLPNFVCIGLWYRSWVAKNNLLPHFQLRHPVMAPPSGLETKLNDVARVCTTTNLPLSNNIKTTSVEGEVVPHFLSSKNVTTNRQTKNSIYLVPPGSAKSEPMVIDKYVLAPLKRFRVWHIVSPLGQGFSCRGVWGLNPPTVFSTPQLFLRNLFGGSTPTPPQLFDTSHKI